MDRRTCESTFRTAIPCGYCGCCWNWQIISCPSFVSGRAASLMSFNSMLCQSRAYPDSSWVLLFCCFSSISAFPCLLLLSSPIIAASDCKLEIKPIHLGQCQHGRLPFPKLILAVSLLHRFALRQPTASQNAQRFPGNY
jgi:hypothetical protein